MRYEFRRYDHRRSSDKARGWLLYLGWFVFGSHRMGPRFGVEERILELTAYPQIAGRRIGPRGYHSASPHVHLPGAVTLWVTVTVGPGHYELHLGVAWHDCYLRMCRRKPCWQRWLWWRTIGRRA